MRKKAKHNKTLSDKELIERSINRIRKLNPEWVSFFQNVIQHSVAYDEPVSGLVRSEFRRVSSVIKDLPDPEITTSYIKKYAQTHFNLDLK